MHKYITPEVFTLVDNEVYDGVPIAKRVREAMDYDILQVVQDDKEFWLERVSTHTIPKYVREYLAKLISKHMNIKFNEEVSE